MVQEKKNKGVHMEQTRRQETIPNRLHSVAATLTLPGADIDSDHNLLVAEVQTRLKSIKKLRRGNKNGIWNESRANKTM